MNRILRSSFLCVSVVSLAVSVSSCGKPASVVRENTSPQAFVKSWAELFGTPQREKEGVSYDLRGYGKISASGAQWKTSGQPVALVVLETENPEKAGVVASKFASDLAAYGAVSPLATAPLEGGKSFEVRHGGLWTVGIQGRNVFILSGENATALAPFAKKLNVSAWAAPIADGYPRYLDNFDNAGLGIWWMPTTKPTEILEFFREKPGVINAHGQKLSTSFAPNVYEVTGVENIIAQANLINKPYRLMLWADYPLWWESAVEGEHHGESSPSGARLRSLFEEGGYQTSQTASPRADAVHLEAMIHYMNHYENDPNLLAWMEPHGEFFQGDPLGVPYDAQNRFPEYLQKVKGMTLDQVKEAYNLQISDWKEVPYPDLAFFYGRRGAFFDLDEIPWRWKAASLEKGMQEGFEKPDFNDATWSEDLRTGTRVLSQFAKEGAPVWFRFTVDIPAEVSQGEGPLYLHIMPYSEGKDAKVSAWINGSPAEKQTSIDKTWMFRHIEFDVAGLVRPGANQITIYSSTRIKYRVFLSREKAQEFPFSDVALNRLWLDWSDFYRHAKLQTLKHYLEVMRAIDPVRPIKVMTPHLFQAEAMDLLEKYGAYPQLTGEGAGFYRPMHYKGYSRLRGMPGSSEPGGAMQDNSRMQGMFANIFWESQDIHDYVFDAQRDFWSKPSVVQWWGDNAQLLSTLGKIDFAPITVGVLRDVEQDSRFKNDGIWKWDLSRGPLPSAGVTPVLIDGPEFDRGLADKVPVIFDNATSVMTPERVAAIQRYVDQGGIFIAQFNTGRHEPLVKDSWPLAKALGLKIRDFYEDGNLHNWPTAKITFTAEQTLLPSLQGKEVEGSGVSIDFLGQTDTGAIRIETNETNVTPIAKWADGTMAVCEVRMGKGRFIWMGTPFHVRFKDENGKWMNEADRQALLEELLVGLGVPISADSSDERVWIERRESKNGLYDVYLAIAMNIRGQDWKITDEITSDLLLRDAAHDAVVDVSTAGIPDIAAQRTENGLLLKSQSFTPFQTRQFAVLRKDAGLEAPFIWLATQQRQWRALELPAVDLEAIQRAAAEEIKISRQDGIDLGSGWKARVSTDAATTPDDAWRDAGFDTASWSDAKMGTWLANGWPDARRVQYLREVEVPADWQKDGRRVLLGFQGHHLLGMKGTAKLWLNGVALEPAPKNGMLVDVSDKVVDGKIRIALDVSGTSMGDGPAGTFFLRNVDKPSASIDLAGPWETYSDWGVINGSINLPGSVADIFGLRRTFELPADWAGSKIRLVIDQDSNLQGLMINGDGYMRIDPDNTESWAPYGPRIDAWLKPGTNTIDLYPSGHHNLLDKAKMKFFGTIRSIRLERYE